VLGINATEERVTALREEMGLNRSLPDRYFGWLGGLMRGDLGNSVRFQGEAVSGIIRERLPVSFFLALLSLSLILIIAVPVSLFSVRREGGLTDRIVPVCTAIGISVPGFFLGILCIWIFGIGLRLFTPGVFVDYRISFGGFIACLFFPALAIAVPNAAILVKFLRSSLFKEKRRDYFRTARAGGASLSVATRRHALRNALIPSITVLGMIAAEIFSGSIIIEQVFSIPGIGRLLIAAITSRDYPLIQTLVVYIAFIVIVINTMVDIVIQVVDPRIRLEGNVHP
jgi:ABC-type dipeptide/oligopeptide/nickel transport system permease component